MTPITSNLLVQIFVAQRTITTEIDRQIWQEIAEKCLIIASQSPHVKAEEIVRGMPLDSDEFAVRLALNCRTKAQVDSMTFRNLSILESHLPRMHE